MQISLLLMQQIAQLFLILLMGYAVVKTGLLKSSDSKVLSVVFVYLVMPCVVLNAFQIKDTPEIRTGLLYSMGIAVGMHAVFLLLNALFRWTPWSRSISFTAMPPRWSFPLCRPCWGRNMLSTPAPLSLYSWYCSGPMPVPACRGLSGWNGASSLPMST
jgi:hypothetical protein